MLTRTWAYTRCTERCDMGSVLVVDDDDDSREVVARFLRRDGILVLTAPNGKDALRYILNRTPDAVVLDLMMPEMNGVDLLQILRAYLRWATIPVVLLTAYPSSALTDRAKTLGISCLFEKANYEVDHLTACVKKLIADPQADCAAR